MSSLDHPERCAECTTGPTCWINATCAIQRDSEKVSALTPAADAQDSSYRAKLTGQGIEAYYKQALHDQQRHYAAILAEQCGQLEKAQRDIEYRDQVIEQRNAMLSNAEPELRQRLRHLELERDRQFALSSEQTKKFGSEMAALRAQYKEAHSDIDHLHRELSRANDALTAARHQIAALVAEQRESDADRKLGLQQYLTTKQFHQQQADMAPAYPAAKAVITLTHPTIGDGLFAPLISYALIEFMALGSKKSHYDFTAQNGMRVVADFPNSVEDSKVDTGNPISTRGVSIPAAELEVTEQEDEAFDWIAGIPGVYLNRNKVVEPRSTTEIRLDDIEQRMERAENSFLLLQGRVNTAFDRLDAIAQAADRGPI